MSRGYVHVLSHRSGLYDCSNDLFVRTVPGFGAVHTKTLTLSRPVEPSPEFHRPGGAHSCSSTNFVVAGLLIGKPTGRSLATGYGGRTVDPPGLSDTSHPHPRTTIPGSNTHGCLTPDAPATALVDATEQMVAWARSARAPSSRAHGTSTPSCRCRSPAGPEQMQRRVPAGTVRRKGRGCGAAICRAESPRVRAHRCRPGLLHLRVHLEGRRSRPHRARHRLERRPVMSTLESAFCVKGRPISREPAPVADRCPDAPHRSVTTKDP
ncbi:serine hydrolase domain-containing protein [Streptomyces sp. KMM 9044]|uniref:serine hydrolase domain-containing protein n=1 Tax=Streptomyces sp. KMM 9044 TaxID=2744474 RepID=UPI002151F07F|nr:serine hydrolase domain-containing protein [Streptomyces sp. KMM 9044]WAX81549.1 serine hydrolase [Streptomyces sp. KMM 9044]